jgi:hypothetical protein
MLYNTEPTNTAGFVILLNIKNPSINLELFNAIPVKFPSEIASPSFIP